MDYNITAEQKFQFMQKVLKKDVHRFFLESVEPKVETYHEASNILEKQYTSVVGQTRIKHHLSRLCTEALCEGQSGH